MKHWKVDYAAKFGGQIIENCADNGEPLIIEAKTISAALNEAYDIMDEIKCETDADEIVIWNTGIMEDDVF